MLLNNFKHLTKPSTYLYNTIRGNRSPRQDIWLRQCTRTRFDLLYTIAAASNVFGNFEDSACRSRFTFMQDILCRGQWFQAQRAKELVWRSFNTYRFKICCINRIRTFSSYGKVFDSPASWISECKTLDARARLEYSQNGVEFETSEIMLDIGSHIFAYNYLVSKILKDYHSKNNKKSQKYDWKHHKSLLQPGDNRLTGDVLPFEFEQLQNIFIESFSILLYCIFEYKKNSGSKVAGVDNIAFVTLKNEKEKLISRRLKGTRYSMSTKRFTVKKDKPSVAELTTEDILELKDKVQQENQKLVSQIIKRCTIKSFRKNYKATTIKRIWIPKEGSVGHRPLGIPSLRDRILQRIVVLAIHPIVEYQSDPHSFGFRPQRSAKQAVSIVAASLSQLGMKKLNMSVLPKSVSKDVFMKFTGKKLKLRKTCLTSYQSQGKVVSKRRRAYNYTYWICEKGEAPSSKFVFHSYNKFINVDINQCFDKISHKIILQQTPLSQKYKFLLKAWLRAPIYGPLTFGSNKLIKILPKCGVPQGSVIGPTICNIVLDGLEQFLLQGTSYKHKRTQEEVQLIRKFSKVSTYDQEWCTTRLRVLRFADDILILGKASMEEFEGIRTKLNIFIKSRGLSLKKANSDIEIFKPGSKFDYLGFRFIYTNIKHKALNKGKYTKFSWYSPFISLRGHVSAKSRSGLLMLMSPAVYKKIKNDIRMLLSPKICPSPVSFIIDKVNCLLQGVCKYYGVTRTIRSQLKVLDYYIYKRFKKILYRKFGSKPGVRSFVRQKFVKFKKGKYRYTSEGKDLLLTTDVKPNGNLSIIQLCYKPERFFYNNYLDSEKILELSDGKLRLICQQKLLFGREFSLSEFRMLLFIAQNRVCTICHKEIAEDSVLQKSTVQIDHNPRLHIIKLECWNLLLEDAGLSTQTPGDSCYEKKVADFVGSPFDWDKWKVKILSQVNYFLVHKECNQQDAQIAKTVSAKDRKFLKNSLLPVLYRKYIDISRILTKKIRATYKLSPVQYASIFNRNTY